ncbi:MAG: permease [Acidisphaera sp.]|nr:permease [Acidisphaera sp.]
MTDLLSRVDQALLMAAGMFWQVGWSLVLGFGISAVLQVVVSKASMSAALGRNGVREIALATAAGAASSSCSYAAAAVSRTLFKRGAALIPSLAFLFASTNLVAELGIVLYLLMGWQFTAGEWIGGVVLVLVLSLVVRLTYPERLVEAARRHPEAGGGHDHGEAAEAGTLIEKLSRRDTWVQVAQNFAMDWSMLWKDLLLGFLIAGGLAAFVPGGVWQALFIKGASPWVQVPANALLGPIVAILSFVCSIGNVPMAAVLWGAGVSFGGVLAFLYADLLVLPLLDVYRRYYGWKMAAYIAAVFYAVMVLSALAMDLAFNALGWIPRTRPDVHAAMVHFALDYTLWLNLAFGLLALSLFVLARRNPMAHAHCEHHGAHHGPAHQHRS